MSYFFETRYAVTTFVARPWTRGIFEDTCDSRSPIVACQILCTFKPAPSTILTCSELDRTWDGTKSVTPARVLNSATFCREEHRYRQAQSYAGQVKNARPQPFNTRATSCQNNCPL